MEGLEEEDELEVLGNLLESVANRGDCEEPWDVEEEGQDNDGKHMGEGDESGGAIAGSFLDKDGDLEIKSVISNPEQLLGNTKLVKIFSLL